MLTLLKMVEGTKRLPVVSILWMCVLGKVIKKNVLTINSEPGVPSNNFVHSPVGILR